jgi:hypothetical protein
MEDDRKRLDNALAGAEALYEAIVQTGCISVAAMPTGQLLVTCGDGPAAVSAVALPGETTEEFLAGVAHAAMEACSASSEENRPDPARTARLLSTAVLQLVGLQPEPRPQMTGKMARELAGEYFSSNSIDNVRKENADDGKA